MNTDERGRGPKMFRSRAAGNRSGVERAFSRKIEIAEKR